MKRLLVVILFLVLGPNLSLAQDLNKGYEAYKLGDYSTALKEWKPLAEQGNEKAQYLLGVIYSQTFGKGYGVLKDATDAAKWYRLSAEQGDAYAQYALGVMYEFGEGVLQDNVTAHMWYNIASANGYGNAGEFRDIVANLMTPNAIEKATAMASECMNSNYKKCGR